MSPAPYENVPTIATQLISVPNSNQYPASWRTIPSGVTARYMAHEDILLQDGFTAEEGSTFHVYIVPCESCGRNTRNHEKYVSGEPPKHIINDSSRIVNKTENNSYYDVMDSQTNSLVISLHPNPAMNDVTLISNMEENGYVVISLYNMFGVGYPLFESYRERGIYSDEFSLGEIPSGLYVLLIKTNGRQHVSKIIKL